MMVGILLAFSHLAFSQNSITESLERTGEVGGSGGILATIGDLVNERPSLSNANSSVRDLHQRYGEFVHK